MEKPNIVFWARVWYSTLYSQLQSEKYNSFIVVNSIEEKKNAQSYGATVVACFEEEFDLLPEAIIPENFLVSQFYSDRLLGYFNISDRKKILGKEISFWRNVFNARKYTFCIHETIALEIDEVLSKVAKEFKVIDLTHIDSVYDDHSIWKSSPYFTTFDDERYANIKCSENDLSYARKYIEKVKLKGHKPTNILTNFSNVNDKDVKIPVWRLLIHFLYQVYFQKKLNIVESPATKISRTLFYYNDHKEHNTDFINKWADHIYHTVNDYNKLEEFKGLKIIFYPLHFEPEATLLYFNPKFSEQINVLIETLKVLPPDYVLVVKEHPAQPQKLLSKEFVNLRNRVSNLKFLPGNANSFEIIKQSEFVLTIVGSVGWEALINNIPVVVLGNVYYDKHPGVKKIADFNVLKEICNGNIKLPRPKDEDTLEYAAKLFHIAFPANTNYKSHINDLENVEKFKMAIEKEIERYELEKDKYWLMNPSFSNLN